jgi:hypothetical protein
MDGVATKSGKLRAAAFPLEDYFKVHLWLSYSQVLHFA